MSLMKKVLLFICFLLFIECSEKDSISLFEFVDYSFSDGWRKNISVIINKDGDVVVLDDDYCRSKTYISFKLKKAEIDSIKMNISNLDMKNLHHTYIDNCDDCQYYNLLIKISNDTFRIFVRGTNNINTINVDNMINYMNQIVFNRINSQSEKDSLFISKIKSFNVIPSMDISKSIP